MPDMDEKLRSLLGDEQRIRQLLDFAQMITGDAKPAAPSDTEREPAPEPELPPAPDTAQLLSAILAQPREDGDENEHDSPPDESEKRKAPAASISAMVEVLPQLLQAFSGDSSALPDEKLNLVRAIRPYAAAHSDSIDRAIKMASIAKAAKNALGALGRPF